ncbi:hypothetical protein BJX61DRAFT_112011 [Aspergillus egyptiacus]|nr:hypothetical protein BJX61DRAFT_112011 [Aspergillus egyptiacus]
MTKLAVVEALCTAFLCAWQLSWYLDEVCGKHPRYVLPCPPRSFLVVTQFSISNQGGYKCETAIFESRLSRAISTVGLSAIIRIPELWRLWLAQSIAAG